MKGITKEEIIKAMEAVMPFLVDSPNDLVHRTPRQAFLDAADREDRKDKAIEDFKTLLSRMKKERNENITSQDK